jgi:hypothetical protein
MANKKSNSYKRGTILQAILLDLVERYIGKTTRNFLERRGGIMKMVGALTLIALAVIFFVWLHYYTRSSQQTATITGNNSPVIQNSPNSSTTVRNYSPDIYNSPNSPTTYINNYNITEQKGNPKVRANAVPQIPRQFNEPPVPPTGEPPYFNKQQLKGESIAEVNEPNNQ